MVVFCPLASGSKGNCIFVGTKNSKLLIDAGISAKNINEKLQSLGTSLQEIDAIMITHEHTDHIAGLKTLAFKFGIPIIANTETAKAIVESLHDCPKFKIFITGETFEFKDFEIHPFSVQHDARDPVAFTITTEGHKLGVCTDLGFATTLVQNHLQNCSVLMVEANHKPSMVHASPRPMIYKQRVLSRTGHLSNEACAELLAHVAHDKIQQVYLAHLSSECNTPQTATDTVSSFLSSKGIKLPITIAHQDKMSSSTTIHI